MYTWRGSVRRVISARKATKGERETTIGRSTRPKRSVTRTDWDRFAALTDAEIRKGIRSDPDAAPEADAAWFRRINAVLRAYVEAQR